MPIYLLIILMTTIACFGQSTSNVEREDSSKLIGTNQTDTVVSDSTLYSWLNYAYMNKDTSLLNRFFSEWHNSSIKMKMEEEDSIYRLLNGIFYEVFNPFKVELFGYQPIPHFLNYKYVILPAEIHYKVIEDTAIFKIDPFELKKVLEYDILKPFYPKKDFENAKILYDIVPYNITLKEFFKTESFKKAFYMDTTYFILSPDGHWENYLITPDILGVLINKQLNKSVVYLCIESNILRIRVSFVENKWEMKSIELLWVE